MEHRIVIPGMKLEYFKRVVMSLAHSKIESRNVAEIEHKFADRSSSEHDSRVLYEHTASLHLYDMIQA